MGKHFALTMQLPRYQSEKETKKNKTEFKIQHYGLPLFCAVLITALAYLFLVNSFATVGYKINNLQDQVSTLQDQYQKLQVQSAELQSMQRIQTDPEISKMVPVTSINYLGTTSLTQR